MKAVALDAVIVIPARNGEAPDDLRVRAMECRIEGSRLCKIRPEMPDRTDQPKALRLMQRREHRQLVDRLDCRIVDPDRSGERIATVNHAVADSGEAAHVEMLAEPAKGLGHDLSQVVGGVGLKIDFKGRGPFRDAEAQWLPPKVDHPLCHAVDNGCVDLEEADLDCRGASIECQQQLRVHDGNPFTGRGAATNLASAADAIRAVGGSARLVSMIGTRAPSTSPAAIAPAK